jgi:NhaP-type Na+/H+ or K+/H+ antiporter
MWGTGRTLEMLKAFLFGYDISFGGAIMGLIWGFVFGSISGALIAWIYNKLHKALYKSEGTRA